MQEEGQRGAQRHGDVGRQPVIPDTHVPSGRGHHVDRHRGVRHRDHPEREPVHGTQNGEKHERPGNNIAREETHEHEIAHDKQRFPGEVVYHKAGKRSGKECRQRVGCQNRPDQGTVRVEFLDQVKGEHGQ